jgi:hypothetical protein
MPNLTYYIKLQCWDLPLEVSPDNLTDHNQPVQKTEQKTELKDQIVQKQI